MFFKISKIIFLTVLIFSFLTLSVFVGLVTFFPGLASATTAGPNFPASATDDSSTGTSTWATPGSATASDDTYTSVTLVPSEVSHYLKATNFGFSIPGGATINGITVEWEVQGTTGLNDKDNAARIVKAGVIGSTDRSNATSWTSSDVFLSHGGPADLWGTTWTPADINASNFGAALSVVGDPGSPTIALVDSVRITVTYTVAATSSISGTVYTDQGVTTMGAGKTVSVSINGAAAAASTTTASNGTYTLSGLTTSAGDVLNVYLDNNTEKGTTVTVGNGSNLTNIDIYQNYLITRCDNSCSLTNSNLDTADNNGDADITAMYSVSGGNLTLASLKSLFIPSSKTYAPGGNVSVGLNFVNNGTYTKGTETITLADTSSTAKVFAGGNGSYQNLAIAGGGSGAVTISGNNSFNDITIGAPKTVTVTASSTQTIAGNFVATGSASNAITINSTSAGVAGILSKSSGTVNADYLILQDSNATGGATWFAGSHSVAISGVTGWIFSTPLPPGGSGTAPNFIQTYYQIFKNDGALNNASSYTNENESDLAINAGEIFRLRFQVLNNGTSAGSIARRLEYQEDNGVWKRVPLTGNKVVMALSDSLVDAAPTTAKLTKAGNFQAGQGKDLDSETSRFSLVNGSYVEDEFSVAFGTGAIGHFYQFRISEAGNPLQGYLKMPSILADSLDLVISNLNPEQNAILKTANPVITFTINKAGDCRASLSSQNFDQMTILCSPKQSTTQSCKIPNLGNDGVKVIYLACQDALGNKGSTVTINYQQKTAQDADGLLLLNGALKMLGNLLVK